MPNRLADETRDPSPPAVLGLDSIVLRVGHLARRPDRGDPRTRR
jgi:hypothetical protein